MTGVINNYYILFFLSDAMALLKRNSMLAKLYEVKEVNAISALMEQFYSDELEKKNKRMMVSFCSAVRSSPFT